MTTLQIKILEIPLNYIRFPKRMLRKDQAKDQAMDQAKDQAKDYAKDQAKD